MNLINKVILRLQRDTTDLKSDWQTMRLARSVAAHCVEDRTKKTVTFFNVSTFICGHSLNAAFSLLASWAIRLHGVPVVHFVCQAGMSRCLQGTDQDNLYHAMPCRRCLSQSKANFINSNTSYFNYTRDPQLAETLAGLDIQALMRFEYPFENVKTPLGELVLPSVRWQRVFQTRGG